MACILLAYASSFSGQFQFDDWGDFVNRTAYRTWPELVVYLQSSNRPLGAVSFAMNRWLHGFDVWGYHAVNLGIHVACAGTLYSLVLWHLKQRDKTHAGTTEWLAAATALLWAVHPLTTQGVTYIVQRYESLAALFTLICLRAFIGTAQHGNLHWWFIMTASAWLGVWSKEPAAMLPILVLTFDWVFTHHFWIARGRQRIVALLLVASPYLWFAPSVSRWLLPDPASRTSMGFNLKHLTPWQYLRTEAEVLLHYIGQVFWPAELCFDYVWPVQNNPLIYLGCGSVIVTLLLLALVLTWQRRATGWLMLSFFIYLAPTSSILPIADLAFEHRMYLPLAAITTMSVLGLALLLGFNRNDSPGSPSRQSPSRQTQRWAFCVVLACAILGCMGRTHARNLDYHSDERLWAETYRQRPHSGRAAFMLAVAKSAQGDWQAGRELTEQALRLQPGVAEFHVGYAECLRHFGDNEKAIERFSIAIRLKPELADAYQRRGYAHETLGHRVEAESDFRSATERGSPEGKYNLATLLLRSGRFADAARLFEELTVEQPQFDRSLRRWAWVLATASDSSVRDGATAVRLMQDKYQIAKSVSAYGWDTYAAALAECGQFDEAIQAVDRAIALADDVGKTELAEHARRRRVKYAQHQPHRDDGTDQDGDTRPQPAQLSIPDRGAGA